MSPPEIISLAMFNKAQSEGACTIGKESLNEDIVKYECQFKATEPTSTFYVLNDTLYEQNMPTGQVKYYRENPNTLFGRYSILCNHMTLAEESIKGVKGYSEKSEASQVSEWLSFLEDKIPEPLLNLIYPEYCEFMTKYSQYEEEEKTYCSAYKH